jgi:hypothetical protein
LANENCFHDDEEKTNVAKFAREKCLMRKRAKVIHKQAQAKMCIHRRIIKFTCMLILASRISFTNKTRAERRKILITFSPHGDNLLD